MSEPFIAEVKIFAGNFAPRGWAFCNGQLLPIAQNTALFALVGTTYGGDGRTTFGLPNLQGRAAMHPGRGPGLTPRRLGESGGSVTASLNEAQLAPHSHTVNAYNSATSATPNNAVGLGGATMYHAADSASRVAMNPGMVGSSGGAEPHNNRQPYLGMSFIIALVGIFPPRS